VVNQTLVFQIKFCGKSPALRVAAKRCASFSSDRKPKKNKLIKSVNCKINLYICIQTNTIRKMFLIKKTTEFDKWLRKLKDIRAKAKILIRIQKLENDEHFEDCENVGEGIRELKINYAKGYRVYFKEQEGKVIILLIGGDKSTQQQDIEKAKEILNLLNLKDGSN
jgi:putative addiction module killer protein